MAKCCKNSDLDLILDDLHPPSGQATSWDSEQFGTKSFSGHKCLRQLRKNPSGASIAQSDLAPDRLLVDTHQRCTLASQRPSKNRWSEERKGPRKDTSISSLRRYMLACELIHSILRLTRRSSGRRRSYVFTKRLFYRVAQKTKF